MYHVFLADDEPWALMTLKNMFEWSDYGLSLIHISFHLLWKYAWKIQVPELQLNNTDPAASVTIWRLPCFCTVKGGLYTL